MPLKTNSKKTLDIYASQKKKNATQAYKEVHPEASDITARTNAHQLLKKPSAQIYLQEHTEYAKETIVDVMQNSRSLKDEPAHAKIAVDAGKEVLDRNLGKATQRIEQQSTSVNLNLDLTKVTSVATDTQQG